MTISNRITARCPRCQVSIASKTSPTVHQSGTYADKRYWLACDLCGLEGPKEVERDLARPGWNRLVRKWKDETNPNQPRRFRAGY